MLEEVIPAEVEEEFGSNYHCNGCQRDITNHVRVRCAQCTDFDLCVTCFSNGVEPQNSSHKNYHAYRLMEILDFAIFEEDWGADEELKLITAIEQYGLGNWEQAAQEVGSKDKLECAEHYNRVYIQSESFPLPDMSRQFDRTNRLSQNREPAPKPPKPERPPASQPACHEVAGYMPGRREFETEWENDAEQMIKDIEFLDSDTPEDVELKMAMFSMYNAALDRREQRKALIFDRGLDNYKKLQQLERKRSKEEKDLYKRMSVFARMQTKQDFEVFMDGLMNEMKLRSEIARLQEWRRMGITDRREGEVYERDKSNRDMHRWPSRSTGRSREDDYVPPVSRASSVIKAFPPPPQPTGTTLSSPAPSVANTPPPQTANIGPAPAGARKAAAPLDISNAEGVELLTHNEQQLCTNLRLFPKSYLVIKETILKEYAKQGSLRRRQCRELIKIDVNKTSRIYDFFVEIGWIKNIKGIKK